MQYSFELVPTTRDLDDVERLQVESFSRRFQTLWGNYEDMRSMGWNPSGSYFFDKGRVTRSEDNSGVNEYRLKSFLTDYRHFSGKEPANFHSMCGLVQKVCREDRVVKLINEEKQKWDRSGFLSGWRNDFNADEVIDAMEKEEIFHTIRKGGSNKASLSDLKRRLDDKALWSEVSLIVYNRMLAIRNVHVVIKPLRNGENAIQIPVPSKSHSG